MRTMVTVRHDGEERAAGWPKRNGKLRRWAARRGQTVKNSTRPRELGRPPVADCHAVRSGADLAAAVEIPLTLGLEEAGRCSMGRRLRSAGQKDRGDEDGRLMLCPPVRQRQAPWSSVPWPSAVA